MRTVLLFIIIGLSSCTTRTEKFTVRQNAIDHIQDLESIKQMILKNITRLEDSCCQNLNACNEPDSSKKNYFFPATYFLLDKYLPEKEKEPLKILKRLSPGQIRSSANNIIIADLSFRPDSTIVFPVADYTIGDTIISHIIIYCLNNNKKRYSPNDSLYKEIPIALNWKYYIFWSIDQGR